MLLAYGMSQLVEFEQDIPPLSTEDLQAIIVSELRHRSVHATADELRFEAGLIVQDIHNESNELFELYTKRLVERLFGAWLNEHGKYNDPLTEDYIRDFIGDFQDIVWSGYGDDAIQVD